MTSPTADQPAASLIPANQPCAAGHGPGRPSSELPVAYLNQVGGNDELVFDGGSTSPRRRQLELPAAGGGGGTAHRPPLQSQAPVEEELVPRALVLGVRDYAGNGFQRVSLGLSGGIDPRWWR